MKLRITIILLFCLSFTYGQFVYQQHYKGTTASHTIDSTSELTSVSAGTPLNEWTGGANIYSLNGSYATCNTNGFREDMSIASLPDLTGKTIVGIKFQINGSCNSTATNVVEVALSWDGGTTWSNTQQRTFSTITDTYLIYGTTSELWGHSWTYAELLTLKIRMTLITHTEIMYVDHVGKLRIYYY